MNVWLFARHELQALRRDQRAWAACACLFLLLVAAFVSSVQMVSAYERTRSAGQEASRQQWLAQGTKNAHSAAHFGEYAFRPLPPLAPFEPGLHGVVGTTVFLEGHRQNELRDAPDADGARLTYLDGSAAFLGRTVLPLLVFLLAAASIAGERERGTLKMLLAQGATLRRIVLGKALAFGALLAGLILGAALLAILVDVTQTARVTGLALSYLLFALASLFLAMAVSIGARTSRRAVVVLFAFWAVGMVLGPRVAASLAQVTSPMPLRSELEAALERDLDPSGYQRRSDALLAKVLEAYGVTRQEELPIDFRGLTLQADEERSSEIFDRHLAALRGREARQETVLRGASVLLPWLALDQASMAFAGTDLRHAEHFSESAETYRRALVAAMNHHVETARGEDADASLWSAIPAFTYQAPGAPFAFGSAWPSLVVLLGWGALSLGALLRWARRPQELGDLR